MSPSRTYQDLTRKLIGRGRRLGLAQESAEDLAQEAFLRCFESGVTFTSEEAQRAYLFRTLKNLTIDQSRRTATRKTTTVGEETDKLEGTAAVFSARRDAKRTHLAVITVSEALNEIACETGAEDLRLFYGQGLTAREIGDRTGRSVCTVTSKIGRLRDRYAASLRERVEEAWALSAEMA